MSEQVTLDLPSELVRQARAFAASANRRFDDVIAEWIGQAVAEPPIESLPDAELLAVCNRMLPEPKQRLLLRSHNSFGLTSQLVFIQGR
jgi:hypothetical protein